MTTSYDEAIPYDSELNYNGGQPIVTADELPTWMLEVENPFTGAKSMLPDANIDQMSFESSAVSAISFAVANTTVGASLLGDLMIVNLKANGQDVKDGRWILRGQGWNAGRKAQVKTWSGRHLLWDRLEHTVIQPGVRKLFAARTPGYIVNDLLLEAQARDVGYFDEFTWTFNAQFDSNGTAWPSVLGSLEYLPSAKYSDIFANLVDKGVVEVSLLGNEIRLTIPETDGTISPALLVVGQDVTDAPQQSSADNLVSDVVILGDDGVAVTRFNAETRAAYWREEAGISQGGTKDEGTLSIFGDVALSIGAAPRVQRTYELVVTQERPYLPLRDYVVGDWVRSQHGDDTPATAYRVKQIVLKQDKGRWSGTLVLNDKFLENELRLTKKVDGIIGGATITGSAQTSTPDAQKDDSIPNPPTGVVGQSLSYVDSNGITRAQASFTWAPPTHNTDGSVVVDLDHYQAIWKYAEDEVWNWQFTPDPAFAVSGLDPHRELMFFVRAIDTSGWWSANQPTPYVLLLEGDTTPPPQPSGPLLATLLRMLVVEWDGLTSTGAVMPPDFKHVEVYTSKINDFDPDLEGDLRGTMDGAGQLSLAMYADLPGVTVYVKLVAVDNSGNRSPMSSQNWKAVQGIIGPDIMAGTITANNIQVGAITSQLIDAGAISTQKLTLGATQNLVQDPSFNDPAWRAKRLTTEWAEKPLRWFFTTGFIDRNGYYLQALSNADLTNGGRMYVTDWIYTQLGESYYFGMYMRTGQFAPNAEATMRMGVEVTYKDGTVESDGINYLPFNFWLKYGYRFTIINQDWVKLRFFIRCDDITTGDIVVDDLEVRGGVGTTEYSGSRGLIDPQGLEAYDGADDQTVLIDFRTGDVKVRGEISSGFTGKRTVINPGSTYLPEIRFYPSTGDQYAYINATETASFPFIGMNAPDDPVTDISNAVILFDNSILIGAIDKNTNEPQAGIGIWGLTKSASEVALYGKLSYSSESHRMMSGGQFNAGGPTVGTMNTLAALIGLPAAPPSGTKWMLTYTTQRNSAEKFNPIVTSQTATQATIAFYPFANWVNNTTFFANFVFWRVDV